MNPVLLVTKITFDSLGFQPLSIIEFYVNYLLVARRDTQSQLPPEPP